MKNKKVAILLSGISLAVVLTVVLLSVFVFVPMSKYSKAMEAYDAGDYDTAKIGFSEVENWSDSKQQLEIISAHEHFSGDRLKEGASAICGISGSVSVVYQLDNGSADVSATLSAESSEILSGVVKQGYGFSHWDVLEYSIDNEKDNYSASVKVKAIWTPSPDTPYKVNYYLENYGDDDYILGESVSFVGETDSTVVAQQKDFEGYVTPEPKNHIIAPDGKSETDYYYKRKLLTVSFEVNGGSAQESVEVKWGAPIADIPVSAKVGYGFGGWFTDAELTQSVELISESLTLYAKWIPNTDTQYVVNYYLKDYNKDTYTLKESVTLAGVTDSTVPTEVKLYEGFVAPEQQSVTILPDGTAVVNYYYAREIITLSFVTNGGEAIENFDTEWGTPASDLPVCVREGDSFGGWFTDLELSESDSVYTESKTLYAYWLEEYKPTEFEYILSESSYTLTATSLEELNKKLPRFIGGLPIEAIGDGALKGIKASELIIPDTVTTVGREAFAFSSIVKITLPASVRYISELAFDGCGATEDIYYGGDVEDWCGIDFADAYSNPMSVAEHFYIDGKLVTEITVPDTVNQLYSYVFYGFDDLKSLCVPDSVRYISDNAFTGCDSLERLSVPFIGAFDEDFENGYIAYFFGGNTYALNGECVPATLSKIEISCASKIAPYALYGASSVKELALPDTLLEIGNFAFVNTSVESVEIPTSVTSIGFGAFKYCDKLTGISLPFVGAELDSEDDGIDEYFGYIFGASSADENKIYVPASLASVSVTNATEIDAYAFKGCSGIKNIILGDTLLSIESNAFDGCTGVRYIYIPSSVEMLLPNAFSGCNNIVIYCEAESMPSGWSANWNSLNKAVYYNVNEETFAELDGFHYVLDGERAILTKCLSDESVIAIPAAVVIGEKEYSLVEIGKEAFLECSHASEITIPDTVDTIGERAFYGTGIREIFIPKTVKNIDANAFGGIDGAIIYCEAESKGENFASDWTQSTVVYYSVDKSSDLFLVDGVRYLVVGNEATVVKCFSDAENIVIADTIKISETKGCNVTTLGEYAFDNCDKLKKITLGENIKTIKSYAVCNCDALTEIFISKNVTDVGYRAFSNCPSLTIYCEYESRDIYKWGSWYYRVGKVEYGVDASDF